MRTVLVLCYTAAAAALGLQGRALQEAKSGGGSSTVKSRSTPRYGSRVVLRGGSDAAAMQSDAAARDANDAARDVNARDDRKATPPSIARVDR